MGVLRPVRMSRIGILGLKDDRERILTALHDLRVAQIEPLAPEALAQLAPERGGDLQRRIGDETLRFRGLMAALPNLPAPAPARFDTLADVLAAASSVTIDEEVGTLKREDDRLLTEERGIDETETLLEKLAFYPDRLEALHTKSVLAFFGEADAEAFSGFRAALDPAADPVLLTGAGPDGSVRFVLALRATGADSLSRASQRTGVRLVALPRLAGTVAEERSRLAARRTEVVHRRAEIAARLAMVSRDWHARVAAIDEALTVENRKVEALQKLGAGRTTFALEAWVPQRDLTRLQSVLRDLAGDRAYLYTIPTHDEPPTLMDNPRGIRRFEFFIRFYSLPQATEWDPTLVFSIVFPLFFGFMLGDWGYGVTILLICLWMIAGFPGGQRLPAFGRKFVTRIMGPKGMQQLAYALLPGLLLAIGLGLYWDEFFGAHLLHTLVGYNAPVDPIKNLATLLLLAGYVGLAMVTLGFAFGLLKEYFHHHRRGVIAKSGGILFAWGIAFSGLALLQHHAGLSKLPFDIFISLAIAGLLLLVIGEGALGIMGTLEAISHILSYTRLVGILLASAVLALVINSISFGLIQHGLTIHGAPAEVSVVLGIAFGLLILVMGQGFNVILGVFEPGIQGARLLFVEYFSKFYSGNGRPFRPFGGPRERTVSSLPVPGAAPGPIFGGGGAPTPAAERRPAR